MTTESFLAKLSLFGHLNLTQLAKIASLVDKKSYHKGQMLFLEGQQAELLFIVYQGAVKVYKVSADGKEQILHMLSAGEIFAEVPVFAGESYPANCVALKDTIILVISRKTLLNLIKTDPQIALNMLALQAQRLREFTVQIESLTLQNSMQRLAYYLLQQCDEYNVVQNRLSVTTLAQVLGMTRENLSKLLSSLNRLRVINCELRKIAILDKKKLKQIAANALDYKKL